MLFAGALAGGCASTLEPAPSANQVTGRGEGAMAAEHGVRMVARADAWQGTPSALHQYVTPLLVTVTNQSARPIRIGYNHFRLVAPNGRRFSALPPFRIDETARINVSPFYPPVGYSSPAAA